MIPSAVRVRPLWAAVAFVAASWVAVSTQEPTAPSPGSGTLVVGSFPDHFSIIDEATSTFIGKIPFTSGIPRRTSLSADRTRFYTIEADMEKVEIVDIASRSTVDVLTLSQGNRKVRIRTADPDPRHRYVMMVTRAATKLVDRFEIGPAELVQYDIAAKKVVRTIPWPNGEERETANIRFSPDGKWMYLFSEQDILVYDTEDDFKQVDKWELSKPQEGGMGRLQQGAADVINDEPGFYTALFTTQDPVQNRRVMGIGRVNLAAKTVEFSALGPSTQVGFTMAPGRKVAFGLLSEIGRYEFWKFDLEAKRVAERVEFKGRPRMSLKTSSNGQVLYIYNAGYTNDMWDAKTFKYIKSIYLPGDFTTDLFVFPGKLPVTTTTTSQ
jgi:hypothetical protein